MRPFAAVGRDDGRRRDLSALLRAAHAVLADAHAVEQWASGRLVKPLTPAGFATTTAAGDGARSAPPTGKHSRTPAASTASDRRRAKARLEQARQDADDAQQRAHEQEEQLQHATEQLDQAQARLQQAAEKTSALSEQLETAREKNAPPAPHGTPAAPPRRQNGK